MKKRRGLVPAWVLRALFLAAFLYLFYWVIRFQVTIASKQQELQSVQTQLSAQQTENAELADTLANGESAIIERIAREQGYAKPNERVFVDISGK